MIFFYRQRLQPRIAGLFSQQFFTVFNSAAATGLAKPHFREEVVQ